MKIGGLSNRSFIDPAIGRLVLFALVGFPLAVVFGYVLAGVLDWFGITDYLVVGP